MVYAYMELRTENLDRGHYTLFCNVYNAETLLLTPRCSVQFESAVCYWSRDRHGTSVSLLHLNT